MNRSIPYMPRFEIVKVPPSRSDCCSFPARARSTISCACGSDLGDRLPLASLDDRNDEPVRDRYGDADVRGRVQLDGVTFVERVHRAVTHQRGGGNLGQEIGDRRLDGAVVLQLHETLAQLERATHVHGDAQLEDRGLPGLGQATRDRLAHRGELLDLHTFERKGRRGAPARVPPTRLCARRPPRRRGRRDRFRRLR